MATIKNSSYKIKIDRVQSLTGLNPEAGALVYVIPTGKYYQGTGTGWVEALSAPYADTFFIDMLGPATASNLDTSSGRIDFNYFNSAIRFQPNARYPNEPLVYRMQLNHEWREGTLVYPHIHWKRRSADKPNWLMGWKLSKNGEPDVIEGDWSNYTLAIETGEVFPYTSGVLNQISRFPAIDLAGAGISDVLQCVIWRDSQNTSGLFAGADPSSLGEFLTDFDIHIEVNTPGSDQEFIK